MCSTSDWGNGTRGKLLEIRGKIYHNACIQIITLLDKGDYNFPKVSDFFKKATDSIDGEKNGIMNNYDIP